MNKNDIKLMSESYKKVNNPIKEEFTPGPIESDAGKPVILTMEERKLLIEMLENDIGAYDEYTPTEEKDNNEAIFYQNLISKLKGNTPESPEVSSGI